MPKKRKENQQGYHSRYRFYSRSGRYKHVFFTRSKKLRRFVESNPNSDSIVLEEFIALSNTLLDMKISLRSERGSYEHDLLSFKCALDPKEKSKTTKGMHVTALVFETLELSASGANELIKSLMWLEALAGGVAILSVPLELYKNYCRFKVLNDQIAKAQYYKISLGELNSTREKTDLLAEQDLLGFICCAEGNDSKNDVDGNELKASSKSEPMVSASADVAEDSAGAAEDDKAVTKILDLYFARQIKHCDEIISRKQWDKYRLYTESTFSVANGIVGLFILLALFDVCTFGSGTTILLLCTIIDQVVKLFFAWKKHRDAGIELEHAKTYLDDLVLQKKSQFLIDQAQAQFEEAKERYETLRKLKLIRMGIVFFSVLLMGIAPVLDLFTFDAPAKSIEESQWVGAMIVGVSVGLNLLVTLMLTIYHAVRLYFKTQGAREGSVEESVSGPKDEGGKGGRDALSYAPVPKL